MNVKARQAMEAAGWELANSDEPGFYVRSPALEEQSPLDRRSPPTDLRVAFEAFLRNRHAGKQSGD